MRWLIVIALLAGCDAAVLVPRRIDVARRLASAAGCAETSIHVSSTPYDDDEFVTFRADGCGLTTYLSCWDHGIHYACCQQVSSSPARSLFRYEASYARCEHLHYVD